MANPIGLPRAFTLVVHTDQFMRHPVGASEQRIGVAVRLVRVRQRSAWPMSALGV
jgi:hypothetical protein